MAQSRISVAPPSFPGVFDVMQRSPYILLVPLLAACGSSSPSGREREVISVQDRRIASLREAIRMERAHQDSFPTDTASQRREAHLREEIEQAEQDRLQTVQPPVDAHDRAEAEKDELRRVDEILRTRDQK